MWYTNGKKTIAEQMIIGRGYKLATTLSWIKVDGLNNLSPSVGKYFSHAKEDCLVGVKGKYEKL